MIWKEDLKLGIETVDQQHRELFRRFNDFLQVVRGTEDQTIKEEQLQETLAFLGEYVTIHFDSEEEIQQEYNYPGYQAHHQIHEDFKAEVADFKREFERGDYREDLIQEFSGRVLSWLINHVADEDQKIAEYISDDQSQEGGVISDSEYTTTILQAVKETFQSMLQREISRDQFQHSAEIVTEEVTVLIGFSGDLTGDLIFSFPAAMARELVTDMSGMEVDSIDKFVTSAVGELANIISGKAMTNLSESNYQCDITPPEVLVDNKTELASGTEDLILAGLETGEYEFKINILLTEQ